MVKTEGHLDDVNCPCKPTIQIRKKIFKAQNANDSFSYSFFERKLNVRPVHHITCSVCAT